MKILLSAYSCGAVMDSEPQGAWRIVSRALNEGHEVWTITEKWGYEEPMMDYLAGHPLPRYHPLFLELSSPLVKLRRAGMPWAVYYHLWQQKLVGVARQLHQRVGFDLAHHVTYTRYWSPSGVRDLGIPFIWGPVGAAESAPRAFLSELGPRDRLFELVRDSVRSISHLDPALIATARAATIALGTTRESCEALRKLGASRVEQMPLGQEEEELAVFNRVPPPPGGPFRALCLGRLLHWKGFYLAIRAFAIFAKTNPEAELWIIGNGPFRRDLEEEAAKTGVASRIRFTGRIPQAELMDRMAQTHVLLHPALHDNFPAGCVQAMAAGRPVVCLDIGGPACQVTNETGFVAPATTPGEAVQAMASFLARVAGDRALLAEMSAKARTRVRENFTMRTLGPALSSYYAQAVASHAQARHAKG